MENILKIYIDGLVCLSHYLEEEALIYLLTGCDYQIFIFNAFRPFDLLVIVFSFSCMHRYPWNVF